MPTPPAIDYTNETSGPPGVLNVNGVRYYNPAPTVGETIGDQLVAVGKTWKSYQESLTPGSADGVNTADGIFNNLTVFTAAEQAMGENTGAEVALYAVKHDPFAYFANVQAGTNPANSLANIVAFDGGNGLYADLASGHAPNFSFIVPNQCNDQHGRGNSTVFCNYDPNDNGTQNGLNPALIQQGDIALQKVVTAIKGSPVWTKGNNAIVHHLGRERLQHRADYQPGRRDHRIPVTACTVCRARVCTPTSICCTRSRPALACRA